MENLKEIRALKFRELRVKTDDWLKKEVIEGLAVVYESMSEYMGMYEIIKRGALTSALKKTNEIYANIEHSNFYLLGKRSNDTLKLEETDEGLEVKIYPTDTAYARDLITNIKSGLIEGMSFSFSVSPDGTTWDYNEEDIPVRTITKISKVFDVTLTAEPAYEETSVAMRDLNNFKADKDKLEEEAKKELEKKQLETLKLNNELDNLIDRAEALSMGIIL